MLTDQLKTQIQDAYRTFLESRELKPRYGQRLMIAEVARTLGSISVDDEGKRLGEPAVCAVEAGTGTGKTVAYCLAALPIAKASGKKLVIATATVALQEQIVNKDLPDIARHAALKFSFTLAKGRGRYLCLSKLDTLLQDSSANNSTAQMFAEEGFRIDVDEGALALYQSMIDKLAGNRWNGDRDSWPEAIEDEQWSRLTTDHTQCTNRYCPNFQQCAFFKAREGLNQSEVIVTNHDLVLADLALGGGAILPDPSDTLYIFDEGHHLPDKAINHFAYSTRLRSTADWLEQLARNLTKLLAQNPLPGDLGRLIEPLPELAREIKSQQQFVFSACESLAEFHLGEDEQGRERPRHRFPGGVIPSELREMGQELKKGFSRLNDQLSKITDLLKEGMEGEAIGISAQQAEQWYPLFGSLQGRAEANWALWLLFTSEDPAEAPPTARWLSLADSGSLFDIEVHASPILAAETLRQHLWLRAHGALVTSATLTALGRFDRFSQRAGLPRSSTTSVVPSPFQHAEAGVLRVPAMACEPSDNQGHSREIIRLLPELLQDVRGALVLFSSRRQMQEVFDGLERDWRKRVLIQGNLSKQETLNRHKARVDDDEPSVLFGLASFAEGVDLPGAYCEHVVIAKLPFAVPDDPVEAALAEWIEARGGNPFMEITVPDAALKLVQACGRLLRSESDTGVISLLDRRVVTKRYGKAILNGLPPFKRQID
ncbi:ATP-dependent DNA helicase DinG [Atopomonas sediminilitoris]|uniref:ATP-dependent DNA helicase DinG n=1 Tax=Atopomonas sediminilitoris TaxID=2919919 RepID=UPI001F4D74A0|nr:ATP-dependent DNA helicase DinG [Atopomonas sediminilitoris]MCJ8170114.1 ATP-dependent DNA helicase DinG [Atopomonas sediminilitoris]